jgi:hypothetical protein
MIVNHLVEQFVQYHEFPSRELVHDIREVQLTWQLCALSSVASVVIRGARTRPLRVYRPAWRGFPTLRRPFTSEATANLEA